ncbi:MAG TPA: ATP-binding protein, partial [Bryobacteraceae bacterium]|nr:ATP-binding protein [Bryobacteraceae bacterium]
SSHITGANQNLSRLILDQAPEAIVAIDLKGGILHASESARALAGPDTPFQSFDRAFPLSAPSGDPFTAARITAAVQKGGKLHSAEVRLEQPYTNFPALLLSAGALSAQDGTVAGCVITLIGIEQRKRAEATLVQQKEQLEQAANELRQFAYSATHDLREPLRFLTLYSQLLETKYKGKLDSQADDYLQQMIQAAHRMDVLLHDLLAYTQAADVPWSLEAPVDTNMVLRKTLSALSAGIAENSARVTRDPLPVLHIYEAHLQQLLQNLISNALKYRSEADPEIHVSAAPEGVLWRITVEDNGIGIDPQYHKLIFGLFKRLHGGGKYSGNGLGLAICQKIVERYGGRIWVESESGKGSRFHFTLPGAEETRS